jgi:acetyltransferase-like isoleucine patch superfamily enzyme
MLVSRLFNWLQRTALEQRSAKLRSEGRLEVGRGTYGSPRYLTFAGDSTSVRIGSFCSIGPEVTFVLGGNHPTDRVSTYPIREKYALEPVDNGFPSSRGDIRLEDDVWIGFGATILSGVTIGHGAVIGAMSLVTRDIPAFAIAVGNPARVVRYRLDNETQIAVMNTQWWQIPTQEIMGRVHELNDEPASKLLRRRTSDE